MRKVTLSDEEIRMLKHLFAWATQTPQASALVRRAVFKGLYAKVLALTGGSKEVDSNGVN